MQRGERAVANLRERLSKKGYVQDREHVAGLGQLYHTTVALLLVLLFFRLLGGYLHLFTWDHCEGLEEVGQLCSYAINAVTPINQSIKQTNQIGYIYE